MNATEPVNTPTIVSADYWGGLFTRNPDFCSWQAPQQSEVKRAVSACLVEGPSPLRVLDFGVGAFGLYRALGDELMQRIALTAISESQQHDPADPFLQQHKVRIEVGANLLPLADIPPASQDRVLCTYVFAYLDPPTRANALFAFTRLLTTNGTLVLVLHHPDGERAKKFRKAAPYWPMAREIYACLLRGQQTEAKMQMQALTNFLDSTFPEEQTFRNYLASYLKTATGFLSTYCESSSDGVHITDEALSDCRATQRSIDREYCMTCQSFNPVKDPATDLSLPEELTLLGVKECMDPRSGAPIANVLTAIRG